MTKRYAEHEEFGRVEILYGPEPNEDSAGVYFARTSTGELVMLYASRLTFLPHEEEFYNVNPRSLSRRYRTLEVANEVARDDRVAVLRKWQQDKDGPWKAELMDMAGEGSE